MIEKIITSKVRLGILKKLLKHPNNSYYVRELSSTLGFNAMAVRDELANLLSIQLVRKTVSGNRTYFKINQQHLFFLELRNIMKKSSWEEKNALIDAYNNGSSQ